MTVKGIVGSVSDEDKVPDIIKHKLENFKIEARLINNKEIKIGEHISAFSKNIGARKLLRISVQIINYTNLQNEPIIPKHGQLLSDIFKIDILNSKSEVVSKSEVNISYKIKCENIDNYCYPIISIFDQWSLLEPYEIESDCIKTNVRNFDMIAIVKEPPNDIICISPSGGLLYSKLDPLISLRVSKGNFKEAIMCKIQICEMPLENLDQFKVVRENELSPYLNISKVFIIGILNSSAIYVNSAKPFRRPISIKLPLPDWVISILNDQQFDSKNVIKDQRKERLGFYFLQKMNDEWNFVESNLKFTNNSVEFDTKHFGSFVFVKCRENRELKLCQNLNLVEDLVQIQTGVVLTFLWIKTNKWFLWLEIVPICRIKETRSRFENIGFIYVEQYFESLKLDDTKNNSKYKRKFSKSELIQRKTFELIENLQFKMRLIGEIESSENLGNQIMDSIINGKQNKEMIEDTLNDELSNFDEFDNIGTKKKNKILENEEQPNLRVHFDISYHRNLSHSNFIVVPINPVKRKFSEWESTVLYKMEKRSIYENSRKSTLEEISNLEPNNIQSDIDLDLIEPTSQESLQITRLSDEERAFHFYSELHLEIVNMESSIIIPTQIFRFYIPVDKMKLYHQIKTKEEKQKEEIEMEVLRVQAEEQKLIEVTKTYHSQRIQIEEKPKQINYNRINGLARPRFSNKMIEKEPKVISRRSFLALSSIIRQGLKLAVYLSIPDNAIAGIGFDALSQMSMNGSNNTTYKVLILWKKMILYNKTKENDYVEQLIYGLKSIGYENIGELVYERWMKQQEITVDDCQRCLLQTIY